LHAAFLLICCGEIRKKRKGEKGRMGDAKKWWVGHRTGRRERERERMRGEIRDGKRRKAGTEEWTS
jgi:hypothetical protein